MSVRKLRRQTAKSVENEDVEVEKPRRRRPMVIDDSDSYEEKKPSRRRTKKVQVEEESESVEKPKSKKRSKKKVTFEEESEEKPVKKRPKKKEESAKKRTPKKKPAKKPEKKPEKSKLAIADIKIDTLENFLNLYKYDFELPINNEAFQRLQAPLIKLNNMIGMKTLKQEILDMVIYYLLKLPEEFTNIMQKVFQAEMEEEDSFIDEDYDSDQEDAVREYVRNLMLSRIDESSMPEDLARDRYEVLSEDEIKVVEHVNKSLDMLHTVICGPPGTGKSHVAQIIGEIYVAFGFLEPTKEIKKINASDLIPNHIGETAMKTNELLQKSIGGVLFLDEAYSMSGGDGHGKNDEFARNSADAFTNYLTLHKHDFVMIVAGYEDQLESRFFALNQGLRRRFAWKFTVDKYTPEELKKIFEQMAETAGYTFPVPISLDWFEMNHRYFPHFGGSMESLFSKVKIVQGRRVIFLPADTHNHITLADMNIGLEKYKQHSDYAKMEETQRVVQSYFI